MQHPSRADPGVAQGAACHHVHDPAVTASNGCLWVPLLPSVAQMQHTLSRCMSGVGACCVAGQVFQPAQHVACIAMTRMPQATCALFCLSLPRPHSVLTLLMRRVAPAGQPGAGNAGGAPLVSPGFKRKQGGQCYSCKQWGGYQAGVLLCSWSAPDGQCAVWAVQDVIRAPSPSGATPHIGNDRSQHGT
jgi:hypothetical protein